MPFSCNAILLKYFSPLSILGNSVLRKPTLCNRHSAKATPKAIWNTICVALPVQVAIMVVLRYALQVAIMVVLRYALQVAIMVVLRYAGA